MTASRQTKLKLRKGFDNAPISYRVLMTRQFTKEDLKEINKGLSKALTPDKAKILLPTPGHPTKWSVHHILGLDPYVGLRYKGLEVALFWKRQTSEVIPAPEDPVPEGIVENPDDVWVRMDLLGKSPRQLIGAVQEELDTLKRKYAEQELLILSKDRELLANSKTITSLRGKGK